MFPRKSTDGRRGIDLPPVTPRQTVQRFRRRYCNCIYISRVQAPNERTKLMNMRGAPVGCYEQPTSCGGSKCSRVCSTQRLSSTVLSTAKTMSHLHAHFRWRGGRLRNQGRQRYKRRATHTWQCVRCDTAPPRTRCARIKQRPATVSLTRRLTGCRQRRRG